MAKKFLSALLAVLMIVSMVPMTAMADSDTTSVAETTPTIVAGVSADASKAAEAIGKILTRDVTCDGDHMDKGVLWFAMTGLGHNQKYSLSVTDAKGNELLGDKYVAYNNTDKLITGNQYGNNYIYVALAPEHAAENGTGKQIDSKVLKPGTFNVKLSKGGSEVASTTITLAQDNTTKAWSGTSPVTNNKIVFQKADETTIYEKQVSDLHTGTPSFEVTAGAEKNSWNVKVTGLTLKYASGYTGGFAGYEQHGYYVACSIPKVLNGRVINKAVVNHTEMDEDGKGTAKTKDLLADNPKEKVKTVFSEYNHSYCDIVNYLGETAEDAKKATKVLKLTYGDLPEQTYTFDFSGLTIAEEVIKAEVPATTGLTGDKKAVSDLQSNIVATTDAATKTIKVTGTSYYVKNYDAYATGAKGNFVALKLSNNAKAPMQLYSPTEKDKPAVENEIKKGWKPVNNEDNIVCNLDNYKEAGYKIKIKVGGNLSEGTDWTIDCSEVNREAELSGTDLQVYPVDGTLAIGGHKGSDLQKNITVDLRTVAGVPTFIFNGESNYIFDWTQFDNNDKKNDGNFIAMKLKAAEGYTIKVEDGSLDNRTTGDYTVILDGSKKYKNKVTVSKGTEKKEYVLDYSAVKRLPAKIKSAAVSSSPSPNPIKASYDGKNIVLSGKASPIGDSEAFADIEVTLTFDYDANPAKTDAINVKLNKVGDGLVATPTKAESAGNKLTFDTSMLVIKNKDAAESTTGDTTAKPSDTITDATEKKAAEEISKALTDTKPEIETAVLQKYADVKSNETTDKAPLITQAATVVSGNEDKVPDNLKADIAAAATDNTAVNTVVQTYAKIEVTGVTSGATEGQITSFKLNITPMARTLVTRSSAKLDSIKAFDPTKTKQENNNANAIIVNDEPIPVNEATDVVLPLPASFTAEKAFVKHTKDDGKVYTDYETTIEAGTPRKLKFTSTHGFSTFEISGEEFAALSKDASITSLTVGSYTVTKAPDNPTYTVKVPAGTDLTKLPLTIVAAAKATVTVNSAAYTANMTVDMSKDVIIVVTAEDGTTKANYTLVAVEEKPDVWTNPYKDVKETDWFVKNGAVEFVSKNGLMGSVSSSDPTKFGPSATFTRAQLATILYRYEKEPDVTGTNKFPDVPADKWYTNGVIWANGKEIVTGYPNGNFGPSDAITREQMAVMLYRYAGKPTDIGSALTNPDANKIGTFAKKAMQWAVNNGIMQGDTNKMLNPKGNADRSQAATMLMNYFSKKK